MEVSKFNTQSKEMILHGTINPKNLKKEFVFDVKSKNETSFTLNHGSIEVKWGQIFKGSVITKEEAESTAKRIVACVNACSEMNNPHFSIVQTTTSLTQAQKHIDELLDWKAQSEIAHKIMLEVVNEKTLLIQGLVNEYKDYIANSEVPPSNIEFLKRATELIQKIK